MIETLALIDAPHFHAGIVLWDDKVIEAADILRYMKKNRWTRDRVREYCKKMGWKVSVVHQIERPEPQTTKQMVAMLQGAINTGYKREDME